MHPTAAEDVAEPPRRPIDRSFLLRLAAVAVVGLVIRVAASVLRPDPVFITDATYFRLQGRLLAHGHGFAEPFVWVWTHRVVPTAFHPPLMSLVHSVPNLFGHESVMTARLVTTVIGTATIFVIGLLGREVGEARVGLVAAAIAAVSPNLVAPDTNLNSEGLAACLVALSLLAAYRLVARPRLRTAAVFGVTLGLAALTRPESLAIALFVLVPLLARHTITWRTRVRLLAATALPVVILILPWTIRSMTEFAHPVPFSTNGVAVVGVANCPSTFGGGRLGSWSATCPAENARLVDDRARAGDDESQQARRYASSGTAYLRRHLDVLLTKVLWARVGRTFSVYDAFDTGAARLDEGKMRWEVLLGVPYFWASLAFAVIGARRLRLARTVPVLPLIGPVVIAALVSVVAYGTPRFRVVAEPSIAVLAAIGTCWLWDRYAVRNQATTDDRRERPSPRGEPATG